MNDSDFMRRAVELSRACIEALEGGPFGAVIVKDGRIVGEGCNTVTSANDPTAHAEIVAIRNACRALATFSLAGCDIYASCEPCPMCLSAIYWARLDGIVYANTRADAARIGFDDEAIYQEVARPLEARRMPVRRLLGDEALAVFREWESLPGRKPY